MSQQTEIQDALARLVAAINTADTRRATLAADVGAKAGLATVDKSSLVAAINEVKAAVDAIVPGQSAGQVTAAINAAITALINGADVNNDTLKELADRITALAQADAGLVSTAQVQNFNAAQKQQACENIGIGNPAFDFVPGIEAALNVGL